MPPVRRQTADAGLETAYCAEVLAVTYRAMGLLPGRHGSSWYDAGRFWSSDDLRLSAGFMRGGEIAVHVPPGLPHSSAVAGLPAREPVGDGADNGVGTAGTAGNVRAADWLYRSRAASLLWLVARLWLGYGWLNAGYQKLWGSEKAAFWNGGVSA